MGNEESSYLGRAGLASQDALDRLAGLSLSQPRAGVLPAAELAKQLPKAAKTLTQLFSPLVAAPADRLMEIVGRQHGEPFRGATLAVGRPRRIVGCFLHDASGFAMSDFNSED
jgi:hypothetical protein